MAQKINSVENDKTTNITTLTKQIEENKEALRHGGHILVATTVFTSITYALTELSDAPTTFMKACPIGGIVVAGITLFSMAPYVWNLETAKKNLEEITKLKPSKASQKKQNALKHDHDIRAKRPNYI